MVVVGHVFLSRLCGFSAFWTAAVVRMCVQRYRQRTRSASSECASTPEVRQQTAPCCSVLVGRGAEETEYGSERPLFCQVADNPPRKLGVRVIESCGAVVPVHWCSAFS